MACGDWMMQLAVEHSVKGRLFQALEEVFLLEPEEALDVSKEAASLIAAFVVDTAAVSTREAVIETALRHTAEITSELTELTNQLQLFKEMKFSGHEH